MTSIDTAKEVAVDPGYYWRDIESAPLGVKLQLLTLGRVAIHGKLSLKEKQSGFYLGWTPLPKIPAEMKERM